MSGESAKKLRQYTCVPCRGDEPPLSEHEWQAFLPQVPEWKIEREQEVPRLKRVYKFHDFAEAMDFAARIGQTAEVQDHHPRIIIDWGRVELLWWTHKIRGLHQNDFIMAARSDAIFEQMTGQEER